MLNLMPSPYGVHPATPPHYQASNIVTQLHNRSLGVATNRPRSTGIKRKQTSHHQTASSGVYLTPNYRAALNPRLQARWKRRPVNVGQRNKIFASHWLNTQEVIYATKCNSLTVCNVDTGVEWDVPLLNNSKEHQRPPLSADCHCGNHTIQVNPSGTRLATGGANVNDIGVYSLPQLDPLCILEGAHRSWLFDLRWIDDECLASCSRDNTLALWRINPDSTPFSVWADNGRYGALSFDSLHGSPTALDKFRSMEYLRECNTLAVLGSSRLVSLYDPECLVGPLRKLRLVPHFGETLVIRGCPSRPCVVAVAGQGIVQCLDLRTSGSRAKTRGEEVPAPVIEVVCHQMPIYAGIRSLNFSGDVLSYGTSSGSLFFYDMRAQRHLEAPTPTQPPIEDPCPASPPPLFNSGPHEDSFSDEDSMMPDEDVHTETSSDSDSDSHDSVADNNVAAVFSPDPDEIYGLNLRRRNRPFMLSVARHPEALLSSVPLDLNNLNNSALPAPLMMSINRLLNRIPLFDIAGDSLAGLRSRRRLSLVRSLDTSPGWLLSGTTGASAGSCAVYTHEYDTTGTRLFCAGGPIAARDHGNMACIFE